MKLAAAMAAAATASFVLTFRWLSRDITRAVNAWPRVD